MLLWLKEIVFEARQTQYECKLSENIMRYTLLACVFIVHVERGIGKQRTVNKISGLPD